MIVRRMRRVGLSIVFSFVVFVIFFITGLTMVAIALLAMQLGLVDKLGLRNAFPIVMASLPASVIMGTVVSLVFSRIPLRPIREIIDAINRLAAGDFSARIRISHTPELRELRDSFNRMAHELNSIELLRNDFINNFSHEFKTPIVSIKGFAELLKTDGLPTQERNEYLDIIIRESSRLATMATNVLNLSRVENQTIVANRERYDLSEQIRRCVLLLQTGWEHKNIHFEIDLDEVEVNANEEMLNQVWVNLIDNAVKFSREKGTISVTLKQIKDTVELTIRDEGLGIAPNDLKHIFDKFYQSDASRAIPGNGLGLTLAQKIVQLHGGYIACQSEVDRWTEFMVRVPKG